MSFKFRLLKEQLSELLIKEIGESEVPPLSWKKTLDDYNYEFIININNIPVTVDVLFEQFNSEEERLLYLGHVLKDYEDCYNLAFGIQDIDTQVYKTDYKTLLKILSTVIDILKQFIKKYSPSAILIHPTEKNSISKAKDNLYKAFIDNKISQIPGYQYIGGNKGHIIKKENI
jgi:hypothetical protein